MINIYIELFSKKQLFYHVFLKQSDWAFPPSSLFPLQKRDCAVTLPRVKFQLDLSFTFNNSSRDIFPSWAHYS